MADTRNEFTPDPRVTGFDMDGLGSASDERPLAPLPGDEYDDLVAKYRVLVPLVRTVYPRIVMMLLGFCVLSGLAVLWKGNQPPPSPRVILIKKLCSAKDWKECANPQYNIGQLLPVDKNQEAQNIIAKALLPVIIHQAFEISTANEDHFNWTHFVLPYLASGSQARGYFYNYIQKNELATVAAASTIAVHVDPVNDPAIPGHYFVGWTMTVYKRGTAQATQTLHSDAEVRVIFTTPSDLNQSGMMITQFVSVQNPNGQ